MQLAHEISGLAGLFIQMFTKIGGNMETKQDYFHGCINPEEVRIKYVELMVSGTIALAELNKKLKAKLADMDGHKFTTEGKYGPYELQFKLDAKREQDFRDVVAKLIEKRMENVSISLLRSWLWIEGEADKYEDFLLSLGCFKNKKRTRMMKLGCSTWNYSIFPAKKTKRYWSKLSRQDLGHKYHEQKIAA